MKQQQKKRGQVAGSAWRSASGCLLGGRLRLMGGGLFLFFLPAQRKK